MSTDADLLKIASAMEALESKFVDSRTLGLHLAVAEEAEFKRLSIEAKAILDHELGLLNDFSTNLLLTINQGSGGYLGGPSMAAVRSSRAIVEGGVNQIRRKPAHAAAKVKADDPTYVSPSRLAEVRALASAKWDVTRLVRLLEELNAAHAQRCHMSVAMLVRAVTDHVPPVFGCTNFGEVANNYAGAKSFRGSMQHLHGSMKHIADAHLHVQIRKSETLPNEAQVDFRADVDVLLAEFVRVLQ
ncbi:hypothetical protein [Roseateles microcysteis]|uniref:hypothetical protein n=1 Tax=Roseateles microcysteis TaxID=3119057 RepID=UPI002FE5C1A9